MNTVHIQSLDLNLLRVFDVLLQERSVTRAASRLNLSQSAVSHALGRLRQTLGDELFARDAGGMTPTPFAREIGPRVQAAMGQLQAAFAPPAFDPATTEQRFVIAAGSYACAVIVPSLVARMMEDAPKAKLAVIEPTPDPLELLDARRVDFLIGGARSAPERLAQETLLRESAAWVVRAENPLTNPVTIEDLVSVRHVAIARGLPEVDSRSVSGLVVRSSWEILGAFEAALQARGLSQPIAVTVPDAYSALTVVRRSDMAALIPRRLAQLSTQTGILRLIEPPYPSDSVDVSLVYLRERLTDPAMAWMRELLREVAGTL